MENSGAYCSIDIKCCVRIGSTVSDYFILLQGVFQGGKWSMRLFEIFYDSLLRRISTSQKGSNIYSIRAPCPTYADDLALTAPYQSTLQSLLNMVHDYACKWRIQFNATKSVLTKLPKFDENEPIRCTIGGLPIPTKANPTHLGTMLGEDDCIYNTMIARGKICFNAMLGIGSRVGGINPKIASKIYWSTVIPSMLYGVEVLALSNKAIDKLEQQHRSFGKRIQWLPDCTPNPLAYSSLGWTSLYEYISKRTLEFIYNIGHLECDRLYKIIWINKLTDITNEISTKPCLEPNSPMKWFTKACETYRLSDKINVTISSGIPLSKEEWKRDVKASVHSRHHILSQMERETYKHLGHASHSVELDIWWEVAFRYPQYLHACRLIIKFKVGMEPLQNNLVHSEGTDATKTCKMCQCGIEDAGHFLFTCPNLQVPRTDFKTMLHIVFDNATEILARKSVEDVVSPSKDKDMRQLGKLANTISKMYKYRVCQIT